MNSLPAEMALAVVLSDTTVGVAFSEVVVFCPNWPFMFLPKHVTVSFVSTTHVCKPPADTVLPVPPSDDVAVGCSTLEPAVIPNRPFK